MTVAFQMLYCRGSATFSHGILLFCILPDGGLGNSRQRAPIPVRPGVHACMGSRLQGVPVSQGFGAVGCRAFLFCLHG